MFCEYCGAEIENADSFCKNCGKKAAGSDNVDSDSTSAADEENNLSDDFFSSVHDMPSYQEPKDEKNRLVIVLIAIIVVLVAIIAGGMAWYFTRGDEVDADNGQTSTSSETVQADDVFNEEESDATDGENEFVPVTGNSVILAAYDEGGIFEPEKSYNDIDYYVCYSLAALYKESGGYGRGQIAQLDLNDIVTVKGGMSDSNWVYVCCKELGIYGWIEPSAISPDRVDRAAGKDQREVVYYTDDNCRDAIVDIKNDDTLNLRTSPEKIDDETIIYRIPNGDSVRVVGYSAYDAGWLYVRYNSSDYGALYGFMSGPDLDLQ